MALALAVIVNGRAAQPESARSKSDAARAESAKAGTGKADYFLQPGDVLKVQVIPDVGLNREERVSKEYTINMPYIGNVEVKGKTVPQVREMIRERYDRDYLVNPQVNIFVAEYSKRTVTVTGQVNEPGEVQFPQEQGLTLVGAIARAKGGTRLANLKKVTLKRTNPDGTTTVETINVDELMKTDSTDSWPLQEGDVITVPERSI